MRLSCWLLSLLVLPRWIWARREDCSSLPASLFAPLNRTGPRLTIARKQLVDALKCFKGNRDDVRWTLIIPGTAENVEDLFGWNWIPVIQALQWSYCTLQLPERGMTDLQISAEYVVFALRSLAQRAERERKVGRRSKTKINILGHSLGGVLPRFAFRFWPDTRRLVRRLIAFGPSNHGTLTADTACRLLPCAPSLQQQRFHSDFLCALNSYEETFPGISYANILTRWDEIINPTSSSELHSGARVKNLYIQDWCPMRLFSEHLAVGTYDYCAYLLTINLLQGRSLKKITGCCEKTLMPGITLGTGEFVRRFLSIIAENTRAIVEYPRPVLDEPELRCVFRRDCRSNVRTTRRTERR